MGSKRANMSNKKRKELKEAGVGRGTVGKTAVIGTKEGTFHKLSPKHLDRYVQEFAAKHNLRESDTGTQMNAVVRRMEGKGPRYRDLIQDNGLSSEVRA